MSTDLKKKKTWIISWQIDKTYSENQFNFLSIQKKLMFWFLKTWKIN